MLVIGGAASGKSDFAEALACAYARRLEAPLVYIATLNAASGGDTAGRIAKHRAARAGKGFITLEWCDYSTAPVVQAALAAAFVQPAPQKPVLLIEDFGNLVANYLYPLQRPPVQTEVEAAVATLMQLLQQVAAQASACIAVTNEITLGGALPCELQRYGEVLARLNARWAFVCKSVYAVIAGLPIILKEREAVCF